ncbi:MAG: phage holin family protein [Aeriscardovia sp.]|nr:phage holin family protein [Aeriscardovia sp.]
MEMIEIIKIVEKLHYVNFGWAFLLPVILMAIDIITGFANAWASKEVQSSKMRNGIVKKVGEMMLIVAVGVVCYAVMLPVEILYCVSFYIAFMEGVSVLENLDLVGVPIPKKIENVINNVANSISNGEDIEELNEKIKEMNEMIDVYMKNKDKE